MEVVRPTIHDTQRNTLEVWSISWECRRLEGNFLNVPTLVDPGEAEFSFHGRRRVDEDQIHYSYTRIHPDTYRLWKPEQQGYHQWFPDSHPQSAILVLSGARIHRLGHNCFVVVIITIEFIRSLRSMHCFRLQNEGE